MGEGLASSTIPPSGRGAGLRGRTNGMVGLGEAIVDTVVADAVRTAERGQAAVDMFVHPDRDLDAVVAMRRGRDLQHPSSVAKPPQRSVPAAAERWRRWINEFLPGAREPRPSRRDVDRRPACRWRGGPVVM